MTTTLNASVRSRPDGHREVVVRTIVWRVGCSADAVAARCVAPGAFVREWAAGQ